MHFNRKGFTLVELMVVIGIIGLLVGVLAVAVFGRIAGATKKMEMKNLGDLHQGLEQAAIEASNRRYFMSMKEKSGRAFWEGCFKKSGCLDRDLLGKLVSMKSAGGDVRAESNFIDDDGKLPENGCSYTSPRANELMSIMNLKGQRRCVLITWDSRNWNNYQDGETIVVWSEGGAPEYLDYATTNETYKMSKEEWADAKRVLGQKKPFDKTFEEKR